MSRRRLLPGQLASEGLGKATTTELSPIPKRSPNVKPRFEAWDKQARVANEVRALDARARQIRAELTAEEVAEETEAVREALAMADTPVIISSGPAVLAEQTRLTAVWCEALAAWEEQARLHSEALHEDRPAVFSIYASRFIATAAPILAEGKRCPTCGFHEGDRVKMPHEFLAAKGESVVHGVVEPWRGGCHLAAWPNGSATALPNESVELDEIGRGCALTRAPESSDAPAEPAREASSRPGDVMAALARAPGPKRRVGLR